MPQSARRQVRAAPLVTTAGLLAGAVLAVGALLSVRPHLSGGPSTWSGDDLGFATTWLVAIVCAAWLGCTTLAWGAAMTRGQHGRATRIAGFAPPFARRILQAALITSFALAPTAAHADTPPAPLTLHVGADGRLMTGPGPRPLGSGTSTDIPVVRTSATTTTLPTTAPSTTAPPTTTPPTTTPPTTTPPTTAPHTPAPRRHTNVPARRTTRVQPAPSTRDRRYIVRAGDNLWTIAKHEVARRGGTTTAGQVARYWQHVVAANRATLRSGDPSLIFPGEVVALPLD